MEPYILKLIAGSNLRIIFVRSLLSASREGSLYSKGGAVFELFKYFIYVVRDSLDYFDPVTDLLVDDGTYLTWRRAVDDIVPTGGMNYAGAIKDVKLDRWIVVRLNRRLAYAGVEEWLECRAGNRPTLGSYKPSNYRGLFRSQPPYADIPQESWDEHKIPKAIEFYKEIWGSWPSWLERELSELPSASARWAHLREDFLGVLIAEGGVR